MADDSEVRSTVSRRKVIKRAMVAGGVALWSAPVVAAATFNRRDAARDSILAQLGQATSGVPAEAAAEGPAVAQQQTSGCTSYPPGTCITVECGGSHQSCGHGAGGFDCFCDVDATAACVCRNDAHCSDLATCNPGNGNGDCAAGYFCIPTSCCGIPKCAPPCGVLPPGARPASPLNQFLPLLNSILPPGTLSGI